MSSPEQLARQQIDALPDGAGWAVQDYAAYNPAQVAANLARAPRLRQSILQAAFRSPIAH